MTVIHHDPDEATLAAARAIKWHRRRKFILQVTGAIAAVILIVGIGLGIWLSHIIRGDIPDAAIQEPDRQYATISCNSTVRGVTVPANGLQLPSYCLTVISVNLGNARIVQVGNNTRTFDVAPGFRSNPYSLERVYPVNAYTSIDIYTLQPGQSFPDNEYARRRSGQ